MVPTPQSNGHSPFRPAVVFGLLTALLTGGCGPRPALYDESAYAFSPAHVAEGALHGRTGAVFTVADAASRIQMRMADLPGRLYRVSTPGGSGLAPQVSGPAGKPRLKLRPTGDDGPDEVTVLLNRTVRWTLATPKGGGEQILDLRRGRLTGAVLGAAGRVDLMLPPPRDRVPITLAGPVGSLTITAPKGTVDAGKGTKRYVVTTKAVATYKLRG
jgi:hypothetical protein